MDNNPTDPDVIETVCYGIRLDFPLKQAFNGVQSETEISRIFTYFGSWNGVMRMYPGGSYGQECGSYDPRMRPWYVAASSGPKDVVIVIDTSASMRAGQRFDLAKSAVENVLHTMNRDTFVNVVTFNDQVSLCAGH